MKLYFTIWKTKIIDVTTGSFKIKINNKKNKKNMTSINY